MVNFQESMTILNACLKKSGTLLNAPRKLQFNISQLFAHIVCSIWLIDRTEWNGNEGLFYTSQISKAAASQSVGLNHIEDTNLSDQNNVNSTKLKSGLYF